MKETVEFSRVNGFKAREQERGRYGLRMVLLEKDIGRTIKEFDGKM